MCIARTPRGHFDGGQHLVRQSWSTDMKDAFTSMMSPDSANVPRNAVGIRGWTENGGERRREKKREEKEGEGVGGLEDGSAL